MGSKFKILFVMIIWGSLGVIGKNITLPSALIAALRGGIGTLLIGAILLISRKSIDFSSIKSNFKYLFVSGACIGINWIFIFQAFKIINVSIATICYYFSPIFVIIFSAILLKEKLTARSSVCVLVSMLGIVIILGSSVSDASFSLTSLQGIIMALLAGLFYSLVTVSNKFIKGIDGLELTAIQLGIATLILLPYVVFSSSMEIASFNYVNIIGVLILGVFHTGVAYYLYFTSISKVKGHTVAMLSYIDPLCSIIFSVVILSEKMSLIQILGGVLVIGSTLVYSKNMA